MTDTSIDVSPEDTRARLTDGSSQLVDVRERSEWDHSHVDGTIHIPIGELQHRAHELDGARPVVFICRVGGRSALAAQAFRRAGFEAYSLDGGLLAWDAAGLPLTPAGAGVATH